MCRFFFNQKNWKRLGRKDRVSEEKARIAGPTNESTLYLRFRVRCELDACKQERERVNKGVQRSMWEFVKMCKERKSRNFKKFSN